MKSKIPDCFEPEKNVAYPLCIGEGKIKCQKCNLWKDWDPYDCEDEEEEK